MTIREHLLEIRRRGFRAGVAIAVASIGGWFLSDAAWGLLRQPVTVLSKSHTAAINYTGISTAFDVRLQVAIIIGVVLSSPVWLYQVFAFLVPGLRAKERRYVVGFVLTAVPLYLAGCAAGLLVLPHIVEVMASFAPAQSTTYLDAKYYLDFSLKLILVTGAAFVLPVFIVLLNAMGVVSGAAVRHNWRWAVLAIALFTAIATPAADVLSMLLLAVPMVLLYAAAATISTIHDRSIVRRSAGELATA